MIIGNFGDFIMGEGDKSKKDIEERIMKTQE